MPSYCDSCKVNFTMQLLSCCLADSSIAYILFISSAEVAQVISEDSYGLVFGVNTFVALVLQTILTLIVSDRKGLELKEADQFLVYGCCYAVLGIFYVFLGGFTWGRYGCKGAPVEDKNSECGSLQEEKLAAADYGGTALALPIEMNSEEERPTA